MFEDPDIPLAIIFPSRYESLQKIIQMCDKYRLPLINLDIDKIEHCQEKAEKKHFIVINQKKFLKFEIDEETQTVNAGAGWRLEDLNEKLIQHGYYIPVNTSFLQYRLYDIINRDEAIMDCSNFEYFHDIVDEILAFLPSGESIVALKKIGSGFDLRQLFIGSNANNGLIAEAKLKIFPLPSKHVKLSFSFDEKISQSSLFLALNNLKRQVSKHNYLQQEDVVLYMNSNQKRIEVQAEEFVDSIKWQKLLKSNPDFDPKFIKSQNQLEFSQENIIKKYQGMNLHNKSLNRMGESTIQLKLNSQQFFQTLHQIIDIIHEYGAEFYLKCNLKKQDLLIRVKRKDNQKDYSKYQQELLLFFKQLSNCVVNNDGFFVRCGDREQQNVIQKLNKMQSYGMNNLLYQQKIKQFLDPFNIFITENYIHDAVKNDFN